MESIESDGKIDDRKLETRWDRIERRNAYKCAENTAQSVNDCDVYVNNLRNKTFVEDCHIRWLNGERKHILDPNVVMDLRHANITASNDGSGGVIDSSRGSDRMDPLTEVGCQDIAASTAADTVATDGMIDRALERFRTEMVHRRSAPIPNFYEYLNRRTRARYIGAKLSRYLRPVAIDGDETLDIHNDSEMRDQTTYAEMDDGDAADFDADDGDIAGVSDVCIRNVASNYLTRSCIEYERRCRIIDCNAGGARLCAPIPWDIVDCAAELKIEPQTKGLCKTFELLGHAAIDRDESQELAEGAGVDADVSVSEPIQTAPTLQMIDVTMNADLLIDNLRIAKIIIDQPKPVLCMRDQPDDTDTTNDAMMDAERNAIISEIFSGEKRNNFVLLQKYFLKWFNYSTIEKMAKESESGIDQTRMKKIQKFLQNITIERKIYGNRMKTKTETINKENRIEAAGKRRDAVHDVSTLTRKYNSKLKLQQDIIDLQRSKLERQERLITELKLNKLSDEAKEAQCELKKELRQVIQMGCGPSRSKARCLQMVGNLKEPHDDDEYAKLQAKGLTMPKFLIEMQARALEREVRHQQAKDRRDQLDREKEEQRVAAEEAKRLLDEESKKQRIEELRQKRRQEKLMRIKKEQDRMAYLANIRRADDFYRTMLLRNGLNGFRRLIAMRRRAEKLALDFRFYRLKQDILRKWKQQVDEIWHERKAKADSFDKARCLRMVMELWKRFYLIEHSKKLVAEDWYDMKILERTFNIWNCVTAQNRLIMESKCRQAIAHYEWNLKWRVLDHWCRLRVILRIERETEARRERWRQKIWELLPDYTPNNEKND